MIENISKEILEPLFDAIPADITFIDADDTVKYYNKNGKREVFNRTPEVIGKKVQNCHPKKSLGKVEEILKGFKQGTLDKAMFWIDFQGKKILIRYFPVKDEKGNYLGCLEVSQNITEIQKLEGEKRLL